MERDEGDLLLYLLFCWRFSHGDFLMEIFFSEVFWGRFSLRGFFTHSFVRGWQGLRGA